MRKPTVLLALLGAIVTLAAASVGLAASTVTSTLPAYNGAFFSAAGPFPQPAVTVGTFTSSVPAGEVIVGATIVGHFGNNVNPSSAGVDVFLNGALVGQCVKPTACFTATGAPWSHTFSASEAQSLLAGGSAVLTAVQTSEFVIRLAPTTLTIQTMDEEDCKKGGWATLGLGFKNQGDCVSYIATGGKNQPALSG
jgi:hypothetical protein